ncbi:hypothetical protein ES708_34105 [subsurface metagenome]
MNATRETGTGEDRKEIADHNVIVKYLDMIFKLKNEYPAERGKLELTGKGGEPIRYIIEKTYEQPEKEEIEKKDSV